MHQLIRLRHGKALSDAETALIMRTLADNVKTYEQVIEVGRYVNRFNHHNNTTPT